MLDEKNRTLHALRHPSLLPLRMALTAAEKESPARPRRVDSNERLAMQLIARMQAGYRKTYPFLSWQNLSDHHEFQEPFIEMANSHA